MGVPEAQKAVAAAQAAYSANKDKALKKALKAAKATLAAEEAKQQADAASKKRKVEDTPVAAESVKKPKKKKTEEAPVAVPEVPAEKPKKRKKDKEAPKVDIEGLKAAAKAAKVAYKADKTIPNKQKLKQAKEAVAAAERALAPQTATPAPSTPAAAPAPPPSTPTEDVLAGLKKKSKTEEGYVRPNGVKEDPQHPKCNRVFVGNLSYDIDDDGIKKFFIDCGKITSVQWIEDKTTGRFKGCGVLDFETVEEAEKAVAKSNQDCLGRPIMAQYSKPRDAAAAPANKKQSSFVDAPLAPKPDGCTTCFVGNLSFEIEDDDMRNFAEDCGEIKSIRWVNNKDTGDFKGCGFVEFHDPAAVDKFILKKGTVLKGRPIRIDYSAPRPPR